MDPIAGGLYFHELPGFPEAESVEHLAAAGCTDGLYKTGFVLEYADWHGLGDVLGDVAAEFSHLPDQADIDNAAVAGDLQPGVGEGLSGDEATFAQDVKVGMPAAVAG